MGEYFLSITYTQDPWGIAGNTSFPSPILKIHDILLVDEVSELNPLKRLAF